MNRRDRWASRSRQGTRSTRQPQPRSSSRVMGLTSSSRGFSSLTGRDPMRSLSLAALSAGLRGLRTSRRSACSTPTIPTSSSDLALSQEPARRDCRIHEEPDVGRPAGRPRESSALAQNEAPAAEDSEVPRASRSLQLPVPRVSFAFWVPRRSWMRPPARSRQDSLVTNLMLARLTGEWLVASPTAESVPLL
jgi:hypothetical protein